MKTKSKCCLSFRKKARPCKRCPLFAGLGTRKRRKLLKKLKK